ncbi:MAG: hypothetical protein LUE93_08160 [Bacteroides sp.]|nr:hypothetical protein [Bacteroides sp.]
MNKLPPIEKIPEAYSAIADNRIELSENSAFVDSSDKAKRYTVTWKDDLYTSNDNGSIWQGYAGYPMIAVLMLQDRLPLDRRIASYFKGINWKALNTKHKNKYDKAVAEILDSLKEQGVETNAIQTEINKVYESIRTLDISTRRSSIKQIRGT